MKNAYPVILGLLAVLAPPGRGFTEDEVKVDGYVHNTAGKAVAGVKVSLYAVGKKDPIESVRTDASGYYKINRKIESLYDMWFSHTQMEFGIIELLAEDKNQHINIKMYKRGEKRPHTAYHESLQSAERLLFTLISLPAGERGQLSGEYKASGVIELIYAKEPPPLSTSPNETVIRVLNEKREYLKKLDRDASGK